MEISFFFFFLTTLAATVTAASSHPSSKYFLGKGAAFSFFLQSYCWRAVIVCGK
jgi:hypothetical protein